MSTATTAPADTARARPDPPASYPPLARLLDPGVPEVGLLVHPRDVGGAAAFQTLQHEGALVRLWGEVATTSAVPVTSTLRALAVRDLVPRRTVLGGLGAAWVLAGTRAPSSLDVLYPPGMHRPPPVSGRAPRQATVLADETVLVAGVQVTGVQRTAIDIASRVRRDAALPALRGLRRTCRLDVGLALRTLELRYRWQGRDAARGVLTRLLAEGTESV
ncbi:hypothetical protein [Cellulosimicrobium arenosum]|uniref:AbiEi antitoxin C-terminal domain-containing protein n=1 Tax=Cellulosimicrobium arenosum TaxID=2708133 RepID=A0A927IYT2_9MICO|nr:hypothetical protein [Cellulosimicrobium arenosum]MBD8077905.1 hypothetical protein [Cellulosimicrobium arenosum]